MIPVKSSSEAGSRTCKEKKLIMLLQWRAGEEGSVQEETGVYLQGMLGAG